MPEDKETEKNNKDPEEDSELEEILDEEEIKIISKEIHEAPKKEFDENALLEFMTQSESTAPSLSVTVTTSEPEVRLESVAGESPSDNERFEARSDYRTRNDYESKKDYGGSSLYNEEPAGSSGIRNLGEESDRTQSGHRGDDNYSAPKNFDPLDRKHDSNPQKDKYLRRFK